MTGRSACAQTAPRPVCPMPPRSLGPTPSPDAPAQCPWPQSGRTAPFPSRPRVRELVESVAHPPVSPRHSACAPADPSPAVRPPLPMPAARPVPCAHSAAWPFPSPPWPPPRPPDREHWQIWRSPDLFNEAPGDVRLITQRVRCPPGCPPQPCRGRARRNSPTPRPEALENDCHARAMRRICRATSADSGPSVRICPWTWP